MVRKAILATNDAHYQKLGIEKKTAIWEDGMRSSGKEGTFEWWYTDVEYRNGIKAVAIFYTKKAFDIAGPANPTVTFELTFPDGKKYADVYSEGEGSNIQASKSECNVKIGKNSIKYVNGDYQIHFENDDVEYTCTMKSRMPMWRCGTGHSFFGEQQEDYFAWFVAQPTADAAATLKYDGQTLILEGNGYHDHNWGNVPMQNVYNHWYWCRSSIGPYTAISSDLICTEEYDYIRLNRFMLAKNGSVVADDNTKISVKRDDTVYHPVTGKFIDNRLTFLYSDDNAKYTVEYIRDHDILANSLLDFMGLSPEQKALAEKMNVNPTYVRIVGTVRLTAEINGEIETYEQEGIWEQMFFGNNKDAIIGE